MAGDGRGAGRPVQAPPRGFMPQAEQAQILADVLAGIELGAWDRQIVQWLPGLDACTVLTVASLIARARAAAVAGSRRSPRRACHARRLSQDHQPMAHYDQNQKEVTNRGPGQPA